MKKDIDVCIIGGCGHVGLPLGIAFADKGKRVALYDINTKAIDIVNSGTMPLKEDGAKAVLKRVLQKKKLHATNDPEVIRRSAAIVVVLGTPVDEHFSPEIKVILRGIKEIESYLSGEQLLILRSTLYPGVTERVASYLKKNNKKTLVACCPERITEGNALMELYELPQIVSGCTERAEKQAAALFKVIARRVVFLSPTEAELAKLFANTWRYINFAVSNQFYEIAASTGSNFYRIHKAVTDEYPRLKSFAKAGLAAGPCLFKDTMQLSALNSNNFTLGYSAMLINEGFPDFIVGSMKKKYDLSKMTVGLLGMAFKAESDDPRESLSYKLKKKLMLEAKEVLCHDPYVKDPNLVSLDQIRKDADVIVIAAPHKIYGKEKWAGKKLVDVWDFYNRGGTI
ncbi:MAG: nucleotide sugar dehydrogenase [Minisyncoccia bacterium]|jgi:UDP-N-acetyl-D-mannosaminuronic acid dehydrogenase